MLRLYILIESFATNRADITSRLRFDAHATRFNQEKAAKKAKEVKFDDRPMFTWQTGGKNDPNKVQPKQKSKLKKYAIMAA